VRIVPRELLTANSPFFHAALTGTFAEGLSQVVKLPEDRADVFDYFLFFLVSSQGQVLKPVINGILVYQAAGP